MTDSTIPSSTHSADKPLIGIAMVVGFCMIIPFGDALVKLLGTSVSLITVLLARFVMQAVLLMPVPLLRKNGLATLANLSLRVYWLIFCRTILHAIGIVGMYFGLKYMPLADTVAICFIYPLIMLFLGRFYLNEQVGPHRIIAAIVGFAGTLLVIQPNFAAVGIHALWPLSVAVSFAFFVLVTRQMAKEAEPMAIQGISGIMATVILLALVVIFKDSAFEDFTLTSPNSTEWFYLIASGIIGSYAHLLMVAALKYAPSATLAPMQYLEMPFATLIGWMIFSDLPNMLAAAGIMVTMCAGLYIVYREQKAQKRAKQVAQ